jgi:ribosomal protein S6
MAVSGTPIGTPLAHHPLLHIETKIVSDLSHNYELAYHANPDIEEAKVPDIRSEVETYITRNGGVITFSREPSKIRLSYPIAHHKNSYFGYINFTAENGETLDHINEQIKLNGNILRYLVIKLPSDKERNKAIARQQKARERFEKKEQSKLPVKENKQLDEQLENIIENL